MYLLDLLQGFQGKAYGLLTPILKNA